MTDLTGFYAARDEVPVEDVRSWLAGIEHAKVAYSQLDPEDTEGIHALFTEAAALGEHVAFELRSRSPQRLATWSGNRLGSLVGFIPAEPPYAEFFLEIIDDASERLSDQVETLGDRSSPT